MEMSGEDMDSVLTMFGDFAFFESFLYLAVRAVIFQ